MVMDGTDVLAGLLQLTMDRIKGGAVGKVEGEMGASCGVRRAEQGHPVTGLGRLEVGPVLRLPGHPQAQGLIESAGPLHVLDP